MVSILKNLYDYDEACNCLGKIMYVPALSKLLFVKVTYLKSSGIMILYEDRLSVYSNVMLLMIQFHALFCIILFISSVSVSQLPMSY